MFDPTLCSPSQSRAEFVHRLPPSRLGECHGSLCSFHDVRKAKTMSEPMGEPRQFSLIVVLSKDEHSIGILIGRKKRGFGKGFFNCFGGKLEASLGEHIQPAKGAVRELSEETGIVCPLEVMKRAFVGNIAFTFEDGDVNPSMKVHLFCIFVTTASAPDQGGMGRDTGGPQQFPAHVFVRPDQIRGCLEIDPVWFRNIYDIPLDNMFADDSLWLTKLLQHYDERRQTETFFKFDAWFHFARGGAETNTIHAYHMAIRQDRRHERLTMEQKLFHSLHTERIQSPSIKEFKEAYGFVNATRNSLGKGEKRMQFVLDIAGGHGGLAALFLVLVPDCESAVVIDPALCESGKRGVDTAWKPFWEHSKTKKSLRYRHECLRTGLRDELAILEQKGVEPSNITVVACHACQHLTDETLEISADYGVNVAVLSCCQKDHDGSWKGLTRRLVKGNAALSIGSLMDLLTAGKMMAWSTGLSAGVEYSVKMKLLDEKITLQNRLIVCKALARGHRELDTKREEAHIKLTRAYARAHQVRSDTKPKQPNLKTFDPNSLLLGVGIGLAISFAAMRISRQ